MRFKKLMFLFICLICVAYGQEEREITSFASVDNSSLSTIAQGQPVYPTNISCYSDIKSDCLSCDLKPARGSSVLHWFIVRSLKSCWSYCALEGRCRTFTFHSLSKVCALYSKFDPSDTKSKKSNLATGHITCLECMGKVDDIFNKSKSGVLIKDEHTNKCLTVDSKQIVFENAPGNRDSDLKSCTNADLWVFIAPEHEFVPWDKKFKLVTILWAKDLNWSLEWRMLSGKRELIVSRKSNSTKQLFLLTEKPFSYDPCVFEISQLHLKDGKFLYDYFNYFYTSLLNGKLVKDVMIQLPHLNRKKTCGLKTFSTKNNNVINDKGVPYFLPGSPINITCNPGYGIKALNFTPQQEVECGSGLRPRRCSLITRHEKKKEETFMSWRQIYLLMLALITIPILIYFLSMFFVKRKRKKRQIFPGVIVHCRTI